MIAGQFHKMPSKEPRSVLAGILALLVHIVFIALLVFGFNWKDQPPEGMIVELWQDLSQPVQQPVIKAAPPPAQPKQQPKPAPQPKSEPKSEPEPVETKPASINAAPPPPKKPQIALKDKTEKPKPVEKASQPDPEDQKKKAQEKAEAERLQRERDAQNQRGQEEQKKREQEEQKRRELEEQKKRELAAQQKREQEEEARLEVQQAAARAQIAGEIGKYKAMILAKIKSRIVMPPDLPGNPVTEFNVTLLPGGDILDVRLRKSSGYPVFDNAVERAILLSKPLPLPPDPSLFNEFRNLHITVHYLE